MNAEAIRRRGCQAAGENGNHEEKDAAISGQGQNGIAQEVGGASELQAADCAKVVAQYLAAAKWYSCLAGEEKDG